MGAAKPEQFPALGHMGRQFGGDTQLAAAGGVWKHKFPCMKVELLRQPFPGQEGSLAAIFSGGA